MTRPAIFSIVLLAGVIGILCLENRAVRGDQEAMKYAYGSFLATEVKGKPLSSRIFLGSLAIVKTERGFVACSLMRQ